MCGFHVIWISYETTTIALITTPYLLSYLLSAELPSEILEKPSDDSKVYNTKNIFNSIFNNYNNKLNLLSKTILKQYELNEF